MPQCLVCGSNVPGQVDVCPDCGTDMRSAQAPAPSVLPPSAPVPSPGSVPPLLPIPSTPSTLSAGMARVTLKRSGALTSESFPLWERVVLGRFDPDSGPVDIDLG